MRRRRSVAALLVTAAFAAAVAGAAARAPGITLSVASPRAGDRVTVTVTSTGTATGTCGRIVAVSPSRSQHPVPLSRRAAVCRGVFRFPTAGQWTLRFGRISRVVRVLAALPTPHPAGAPLGRPGCAPPSPLTRGRAGPPEAFGTTADGEFWALFFHGTTASDTAAVFSNLVGKELKLVLKRETGAALTTATAPDGTQRQPVWQHGHGSSSWERRGIEYGTGWQITEPGCWRIRAGSGTSAGDLWFLVLS